MDEMQQGYLDGLKPDSPEPSENRSHCYRHGFANGRDDLAKKPRASVEWLRARAEAAIAADAAEWPNDILYRSPPEADSIRDWLDQIERHSG